METIYQYLETMFKGLPDTSEILQIKNDLKCNMEEKYEELKKEGKTENEAIGIVISEFGNLDEILDEMDISKSSGKPEGTGPSSDLRIFSFDEVTEYLNFNKRFGNFIAIGVFLILTGVTGLLITASFLDNTRFEALCILPLFALLIPAVALFIYWGMQSEKYEFLETGQFELQHGITTALQDAMEEKKKHQIIYVMISVCLFILSPSFVIAGDFISERAAIIGAGALVFVVGIGVFNLIRVSIPIDGYKKLLKLDDYAPKKKDEDNLISIVASIVWPLTAAFYLIMGFTFHLWGSAWVVFPIVGILFGAFCAITNALHQNK